MLFDLLWKNNNCFIVLENEGRFFNQKEGKKKIFLLFFQLPFFFSSSVDFRFFVCLFVDQDAI